MKKCRHTNVTFLGIQETLIPGKRLELYNCNACHTTISMPERGNHGGRPRKRTAMAAAALR